MSPSHEDPKIVDLITARAKDVFANDTNGGGDSPKTASFQSLEFFPPRTPEVGAVSS